METLGEFVRKYRYDLGETQKVFAKRLRISPQRLSDIENNRKKTSVKLCAELAKRLKIQKHERLIILAIIQQFDEFNVKYSIRSGDSSKGKEKNSDKQLVVNL